MSAAPPVLIAGAGPTGLAAALFLHELGVASRIVDPKLEPTQTSNALAVNPRTQALLEPTGVTAALLREGRPIRRMELRRPGRPPLVIPVDEADRRFTMLALPQPRTEALLTEALAARGVAVERGLGVAGLSQDAEGVSVELAGADGGRSQARAAVLFAADGAHSAVRHALGVGFEGDQEAESLGVADVTLTRPVTETQGFVRFPAGGDGLAFALAFSPERWRIIGDEAAALREFPAGVALAETHWRSSFRISHRLAAAFTVGRVCLGGDAAHIHSPVGARGMNLGVEDAWVFARCCRDFLDGRAGRLARYGQLRREVDGAVVRRIRLLTRTALGHGPAGAVRNLLPPLAFALPPLRRQVLRVITGLDHEVRTD